MGMKRIECMNPFMKDMLLYYKQLSEIIVKKAALLLNNAAFLVNKCERIYL